MYLWGAPERNSKEKHIYKIDQQKVIFLDKGKGRSQFPLGVEVLRFRNTAIFDSSGVIPFCCETVSSGAGLSGCSEKYLEASGAIAFNFGR